MVLKGMLSAMVFTLTFLGGPTKGVCTTAYNEINNSLTGGSANTPMDLANTDAKPYIAEIEDGDFFSLFEMDTYSFK